MQHDPCAKTGAHFSGSGSISCPAAQAGAVERVRVLLYRLICGGEPLGDGLPRYQGFAPQ
jgi:hypothetical protein